MKLLFFIPFVLFVNELYCSNQDKKMFDEICASARQYMKQKLAACEDLACVENVLRAKEMKMLKRTLQLSDNTPEECEVFMQQYHNARDVHKNLIEDSPVQWHDINGLDKYTLDTTRSFLVNSGIDANKVRIHANNIRSPRSLASSRGVSRYGFASIEYPSSDRSKPSKHTIAHEVMHIQEAHTLKRNLVDDFVKTFTVDSLEGQTRDIRYYFTKLNRVYEMQAELLPLLRFKDSKITDQLLKSTMPLCKLWYEEGFLKNRWNKPSNSISTHPGCTELLPFILKIEDLKKHKA